ncbi:MAG: hypothetical protein OXI96_06960 [Acidimicrobiaceae bacterium]|nr:hypothetical protein [Acidimicrobiaceae bacterium]
MIATHPGVRDRPGELVHVDFKKLASIPDGGGWRVHGRGDTNPRQRVGYVYTPQHCQQVTVGSLTRRVLVDDIGRTPSRNPCKRVHDWFAKRGVTIKQVLTENGGCYRSHQWCEAMRITGTSVPGFIVHKTNGKVERFHRTLLEE